MLLSDYFLDHLREPQAESKPICPLRLVVSRPTYQKANAKSRADQNKRILDQMRFEGRIK